MTITATLYRYTPALLFAVMFVRFLTCKRVIFLGVERNEPTSIKRHWLQCGGAAAEEDPNTQNEARA